MTRRSVESPSHRKGELLRVRATFAALALILLSNVFGFMLLSNFLRVIFVLSSYLGLVILLQARAISILFAAAARVKPINALATIRLYEASVVRWTARALGIAQRCGGSALSSISWRSGPTCSTRSPGVRGENRDPGLRLFARQSAGVPMPARWGLAGGARRPVYPARRDPFPGAAVPRSRGNHRDFRILRLARCWFS